MKPTIDELVVADAPGAWSALGFEVDGGVCVVGEARIRLAGPDAGKGLTGWSLREIEGTELDGLPTSRSDRPLPGAPGSLQRRHRARPRRRDRPRSRPDGRGAGERRPRPAPGPRGADARRRSAAGLLPPRRDDPRGRPGAARGDRARRRRWPARLLLGARLPRPRTGRDRRRPRRPRQRDPSRRPARPAHRHPAPRRRPRASGRADDATARSAPVACETPRHSAESPGGGGVSFVHIYGSAPAGASQIDSNSISSASVSKSRS